jgi:hypothetical protein
VLLGVFLLLLIEGYMLWLRPRVSQYIGQQVSTQVLPSAPVEMVDPATQGQIEQRVDEARQSLPTAIAAMPSGELVLSEAEANSFFAANSDQLAPIERLTVQFLPGQVQSDLRISGMQVRVISGLAVQDGRLRVVNPRLDGALGYLFDIEQIIQPIEQQFNDQLLSQGQTIRDARIEQGRLVVVVE